MDQYGDAKIKYPNANFHFVGHSNGTYLGATALDRYPDVKFKRVMFAGSVVRHDFGWASLADRATSVLNLVATRDAVVALFPNAFRHSILSIFDLGGAGHTGFDLSVEKSIGIHPDFQQEMIDEFPFVKGGHSAGRAEGLWDSIADFIVDGSRPDSKQSPEEFLALFRKDQPLWMRFLGSVSTSLVLVLFLVVTLWGLFFLFPFYSQGFVAGSAARIFHIASISTAFGAFFGGAIIVANKFGNRLGSVLFFLVIALGFYLCYRIFGNSFAFSESVARIYCFAHQGWHLVWTAGYFFFAQFMLKRF